jgi:glyoxylase-like metal-dependent hydrolase (beta-lactamase superfamily II)
MVERLLKDIFLIKVPLPGNPLKNLNSFLIKGKDRNLLIDTGFHSAKCFQALQDGLEKIDVDMRQTDIFLTHMHADHAGCASLIASEESRIFVSDEDKKGMENYFVPDYWKLVFQKYLSLGFSEEELTAVFRQPGWRNPIGEQGDYHGLADGHEFDLGTYRFQCILTPGHTPGHMCLYDKAKKVLFCGDHVLYDITPNITGWLEMENSLGKYLDSLEKMKGLEAEFAFCSHRKPLGKFQARVNELMEHHEERLEETLDIMEKSGKATPYFAASKMKWSVRTENWDKFPVEQKMFAVGEADSHLEYLFYKGRLKRELLDGLLVYFAK